MFRRKQDTRNGWLVYPMLVVVPLTTLLVLSLDTWSATSMSSTPRTSRLPNHDDQLSSTIVTASSGGRGTTAEPILWLPLQNSADLRRFPFLSRRLYSRGAKDGITAVFPVTESSFSDFDLNFDSIISAHSLSFYEIVVACHPRIATKTAQTIDKARSAFSVAISVTVLPWGQYDDPSTGMLHILHNVLTSRVLLLDTTALRYIEESTQTVLLESLAINFPIGTRGILVSPNNISCIRSPERTVPAAYLIPPILAPTVLLIEAENGAILSENTWAALGDRIVRATGAGFGGLVLKISGQSYPWCTESLTSLDPVFSSKFLRSFYDFLGKGAENRLLSSTRFNVLLLGRDELRSFSPTICEMARHGYTLRVMLFSWTEANPSSSFALDMGCHIHFEVISEGTSTAILNKRLQAWMHAADFDVLMYTSERLVHAMVIEASLEPFKLSGRTIVRIPTTDLPFCEWMAMLSASDWQHWHTPRIDLSVITNDRPQSLSRLLNSLTSARYYGDTVHMKINLEQTADVETRQTVAHFRWTFGAVYVHHRVISAGLLPAVVEAWYPHDNDSYGVLLEDDVEVSPLFYAWIKVAILRYRYGSLGQHARSLFGVSLYQPRNLELRVEGRVPFDPRIIFAKNDIPDSRTPYLSQVPCSWGAVYFPEHFREFHDYLALRLSETTHNITEAIVPDIRSNRWTRSWKKYFNELVYLRGYVMLYPNYDLSLATNHVEIGAHVKNNPQDVPETVRRQYDVPLMPLPLFSRETRSPSLLELPGESLPAWNDLPVLDFWGTITSHKEIARRGHDRHELLSGCLLPLTQISYDARELLCPRTPRIISH